MVLQNMTGIVLNFLHKYRKHTRRNSGSFIPITSGMMYIDKTINLGETLDNLAPIRIMGGQIKGPLKALTSYTTARER